MPPSPRDSTDAPTTSRPGTERVLCLGDLGWKEERKCDLRYFFHYPAAEFVHVGWREARHARDRMISPAQARARFLAGGYDVVVAGCLPRLQVNGRKSMPGNFARLARKVVQWPRAMNSISVDNLLRLFAPKLAILDLEDRPIIDNSRFRDARLARVYFKRELPQNPANAFLYTTDRNEDSGNIPRQRKFAEILPKLMPVSIGVEPSFLRHADGSPVEKTADVFFAGRIENRPNRRHGLENLLRLREAGFRIDLPESRIPRSEFLRRCASALTVWSPEGFGWDCTRTYEAAAMGAVPLLPYPTIQRHAPLSDGIHALYYGVEGNELEKMLRVKLTDRAALTAMGAAARHHVADHHTFDALARYIVRTTRAAE